MEVTYKVETDVADYAREFESKQAAFNVEVKTAVSFISKCIINNRGCQICEKNL